MGKIKICLDAGHYGKYNQSPAVKTYYESDMNWKLHLKLKAELEKYGIEVITTRKEQAKDMGLQARGRASKGCDLFISIHSNAVGSNVNESIDYPVVYVPINGKGNELGKRLSECVASVMGTVQKGQYWSKKGSGNWDYYGVIYGATSVGVTGLIIEHSFHTNTRATKWLMNDSNLDKLAKEEAKILADYYGLKQVDTPTTTSTMYRVRKSWNDAKSQIGAYSVLENAKRACDDAGDGYYVFDEDGKAVYPVAETTPKQTMYRVRKSWTDAASQIGAYVELKYAKTACDNAGAGYHVFDDNGKVVYSAFESYKVQVTADVLNVRAGAGTAYKINTTVKKGEIYTIVGEQNGWGQLLSGAGWISLKYTKKI